MMEKSYLLGIDQIAKELKTDLKNGLTLKEAQSRLETYGPNVLRESKGKSPFVIFISQFKSFLILILLAAAVISILIGESIDTFMILVIVFMNALIGFFQEYRAEKAIKQLKKLITSNIQVVRGGSIIQIPSFELVPGDLVTLEEGQKVPADIRLMSAINLNVNEASLTGESAPIEKHTQLLSGNLEISDQKNMLFSGTTISSGKATGIVIKTGMETEIGKIAELVSHEIETITPLKQKLDRLGKIIGIVVLIIAIVIAVEQLIFGHDVMEALLSSVTLAVAAIPEGMPAVVTISLALGTRRLLKQNALIRNLPAAETLGSTDIICADKTGTLTEGEMRVRKIYLNGKVYDLEKESTSEFEKLFKVAFLSSNARKSGEKIVGEATEIALVFQALESGLEQNELLSKYPREMEIPFTSERKMLTTVSSQEKGKLVTTKGATETVLNLCTKIERNGKIETLSEDEKKEIIKINDQMANEALRVLSFAFKEVDQITKDEVEKDLIFLGLQGMIDPPRKEVKEAIETCQNQAGIKVVMITGDHLLTAQAVAKELGIKGKTSLELS